MVDGPQGDTDWARRAHAVYRDLMAAGHKPDPTVLDKLVACFRIPYRPDEKHQQRKDARKDGLVGSRLGLPVPPRYAIYDI
jgi:hypothetical protein